MKSVDWILGWCAGWGWDWADVRRSMLGVVIGGMAGVGLGWVAGFTDGVRF